MKLLVPSSALEDETSNELSDLSEKPSVGLQSPEGPLTSELSRTRRVPDQLSVSLDRTHEDEYTARFVEFGLSGVEDD